MFHEERKKSPIVTIFVMNDSTEIDRCTYVLDGVDRSPQSDPDPRPMKKCNYTSHCSIWRIYWLSKQQGGIHKNNVIRYKYQWKYCHHHNTSLLRRQEMVLEWLLLIRTSTYSFSWPQMRCIFGFFAVAQEMKEVQFSLYRSNDCYICMQLKVAI